MTEKQPQTCYVVCKVVESDSIIFDVDQKNYPSKVLPDRYIFTKEELEAYVSEKVKEASMLEFDRGVLFGAKELQQQSKQLNQ